MAAVAEEEGLGSSGHSRPLADGEIRLAARIVRETKMKIPQGLVMWPDVPCVRVTAKVDGLDVSCQEELLNIPNYNSASGDSVEADDEGGSETNSNDQTRPGELILEMQLPKIQEQGGPLPTLSLRVEVLVGRVVTATGTVDLSDELKASLTGSSTRRAVLNLTGGGEISCVVDLSRQAILSATVGGLPEACEGMPTATTTTVPSSSVREGGRREMKMNGESLEEGPNAGRLERFLDSIASWGLEVGSNDSISRVDSKGSSVGVAAERKFGGGNEEKRHVGSAENDGSSFPDLVDWLGRSHPDPTFLRLALEKTNSYAFPLVEAPFLAALLKHGGLVGEAFQVSEMLSTCDKGEWIPAVNGSFLRR